MAEPPVPPAEPAAPMPRQRRLPAWLRYPLIAILGAVLAVGASYMLRKIGF